MKKQILFLFFALLVVIGCISTSQITQPPPSEFEADTQDRDVLEGNAEIKIPATATKINGHTDGFREIDTEVRFNIRPSDLNEFLKSTLCELPLLKDNVRDTFQNKLDRPWWNPADAQESQWCHGEKENLIQNILVDITNPDEYIVYVMVQAK